MGVQQYVSPYIPHEAVHEEHVAVSVPTRGATGVEKDPVEGLIKLAKDACIIRWTGNPQRRGGVLELDSLTQRFMV